MTIKQKPEENTPIFDSSGNPSEPLSLDLEAANRDVEKDALFEEKTVQDQRRRSAFPNNNIRESPGSVGRHSLSNSVAREREITLQESSDKMYESRKSQNEINKTAMLIETMSPQTRGELLQLLTAVEDDKNDTRRSSIQTSRAPRTQTEKDSLQILPMKNQETAPETPLEITGGDTSYQEEEANWHSPFNESIFTFFYMCKFESQGFWYALFVYALQIVAISLTLVDITQLKTGMNALEIPAMVDLTVTIAQAVALFLAVAYQTDLLQAVLKLQDGFYHEVQEKHPGATFSTWLLSCLAQLWEGLLLLATIFILVMQVDNVLSIMLNFAALNFISEIDDVGFAIAKMGFVTNKLQWEAMQVINFKLPERKHRNRYRRVLYFLTLTGLFIGYGILKKRQLDGYYLHHYIYVQFGDGYNPKWHYYSGIMSGGNTNGDNREYRDVGTQNILLGYCNDEGAWTFSDTNDPCDYFAKSPKTNTYDVTTIPNSEWVILDSLGRPQPFDSFSLVGRDCQPEICQGECIDGICKCPHDRFGIDCEYDNVCPELVVHGGTEPFLPGNIPAFRNAISDEFHLLKSNVTGEYARAYFMPVYYSNKTYPANIIFFSGRRWVLTSEYDLFNDTAQFLLDPMSSFYPEVTASVLNNEFHGHESSNYTTFYLSDPVDFNTPDFLPTPSGLGWSTAKVANEQTGLFVPDIPVDTVLACASCTSVHGGSCSIGGTCNQTTGVCECDESYHGTLCELEDVCYESSSRCMRGLGVCDDVSGVCRCNLPFYGTLCQGVYVCVEAYGSCRNGGVCGPSGLCECPDDPAINGMACEQRKDCNVFGCENGGVCDDSTGACHCPEPYHGFLCSLINETQREELCSTGISVRSGNLCSDQFNNNCTQSGCRNEGVCNKHTGLCECPEPFTGQGCSEVPDCTSDSDCIGGGFCLAGRCFCENVDSSGKLCQDTSYLGCRVSGCYNGGTCIGGDFCECPTPYTGPGCAYILDEGAYQS